MTTIKIEKPDRFEVTLKAVKLAMFPNREDEIRGRSSWESIDGIRFNVTSTAHTIWSSSPSMVTGIQMSAYETIRRVMIKDGTIDIDKCRAKFAELKAMAEQEAVESKARQQAKDTLSAEVDEFFRSVDGGVPPGFVIRNMGDGKWTVKYEQTVDKETLRRIVEAVGRSLEG